MGGLVPVRARHDPQQSRAPESGIRLPAQADLGRPVRGAKILLFRIFGMCDVLASFRPAREGRLANVTMRWAWMRWTRGRRARAGLQGGFAVSDRTACKTSGARKTSPAEFGGGLRETPSMRGLLERFADGQVAWSRRPQSLAPSLARARAEPDRAARRDCFQGDGGKQDGSPRRSRSKP